MAKWLHTGCSARQAPGIMQFMSVTLCISCVTRLLQPHTWRKGAAGVRAHLLRLRWLRQEVMQSSASEVRLSASMMESEIQRIQPTAPCCQSMMGPGAHPFLRAMGPRMAYPVTNDGCQ